MVESFVVIALILILYFLPSVIAWNKRSFGPVMAINFFLGWTLVGWVVALAWALKDDPQPEHVIAQAPQTAQASPLLCSNCGKYSAADSQFCAKCGSPLAA
ncbi:MAG: superinfection immunity protein [Candidatus Acidiferrales bacterium]